MWRSVSTNRSERPDLLLHGFGIKITSLADPVLFSLFDTADSNAWSAAARRAGRNGNDWREALAFKHRVESIPMGQMHLIQMLCGQN
jgi:hypothetical protein